MSKSEGTYELAVYAHYREERRALDKAEYDQALSYDRAAITLASGALGLSLTFIKKAIGTSTPTCTPVLFAGWAFLVFAILATLLSFQRSVKAYQKQREVLDAEYEGKPAPRETAKRLSNCVSWLNLCSIILITLGIALLALFISLNVGEST